MSDDINSPDYGVASLSVDWPHNKFSPLISSKVPVIGKTLDTAHGVFLFSLVPSSLSCFPPSNLYIIAQVCVSSRLLSSPNGE